MSLACLTQQREVASTPDLDTAIYAANHDSIPAAFECHTGHPGTDLD